MPKVDGYALLSAVRSSEDIGILPVILLAASAGEDAKIEGLLAGADDYMIKPFHAAELVARVDGTIRLGRYRREVENKLRHEHRFISAILDVSAALIIVLDANGKIVRFNKACEIITGYGAEEMIGASLWEKLIPAEELEAVKAAFEKLKVGDFPNNYENHWVAKNGESVLVRWSNTVLCDSKNNVEFVIGTGIDITKKKKIALMLQLSSKVIENISEAVMTTDKDGTIISVNPAFTNMLGFNAEEALGKNPRILKSDKHEISFYEQMRQTISSGNVWRGEIWNRRKNGELFLSYMTITPIVDGKGQIVNYVSVLRDITEEKERQRGIHHLAYHDLLTNLAK